MTGEAITALAPRIGTRAACRAAGVPQASWYRRHRISPAPARRALVPHKDRAQPRALTAAERQAILDALHSPRFADLAPAEAWDATSQAARDEDGERLEEELDEYRGGSRRSCPSLGGGQRTR